jgi:RNA binding exosome subunit
VRPPISSAQVHVHCHATEDEDKVLAALRTLLPGEVAVERSELEGHHGNPIVVIGARVRDRSKLSEIWERIVRSGELTPPEVERRMDERCTLHLRFDKQAAFGGRLRLTDGGDSIHLRLRVKAFPPRRENAIRAVREAIESGGGDEG